MLNEDCIPAFRDGNEGKRQQKRRFVSSNLRFPTLCLLAQVLPNLFLLYVACACGFGLPAFVAQDGFSRKLDLVPSPDALHQDLLAFFQFVAHIFHAAVGNLGNVQQTISSGKDLNKSTEIDNARNCSQISLANLGLSR